MRGEKENNFENEHLVSIISQFHTRIDIVEKLFFYFFFPWFSSLIFSNKRINRWMYCEFSRKGQSHTSIEDKFEAFRIESHSTRETCKRMQFKIAVSFAAFPLMQPFCKRNFARWWKWWNLSCLLFLLFYYESPPGVFLTIFSNNNFK